MDSLFVLSRLSRAALADHSNSNEDRDLGPASNIKYFTNDRITGVDCIELDIT